MSPSSSEREEYLTIIAPNASAAMAQFKAQDLAAQGYAIAGKIGRHRFSLVDGSGSSALFSGDGLIAATFSRKVAG